MVTKPTPTIEQFVAMRLSQGWYGCLINGVFVVASLSERGSKVVRLDPGSPLAREWERLQDLERRVR